jgi:phosphoserine aminotransferase
VGVVAGSATGAMEMLMWSLLGERGVDVLVGCLFSSHWANDITNELKIEDYRLFIGEFPNLPDVSHVDFDRDLVFCLSATTSGAAFLNQDWIPRSREGLVLCDAASAAFTMDFDWERLDAVAFSWQKGLGGEAGFGTIVLSPRAMQRLGSYEPNRPIPRLFRIASDKKVRTDLFQGATINSPSMICLEDFRNSLLWAEQQGGVDELLRRVEQNYSVMKEWMAKQDIFYFLVDEKQRAHHIACLGISFEKYRTLSEKEKWDFLKNIVAVCEREEAGVDFLGHAQTKPNLRVWMGPTIESQDLKKFLPWLEFAYAEVSAKCY